MIEPGLTFFNFSKHFIFNWKQLKFIFQIIITYLWLVTSYIVVNKIWITGNSFFFFVHSNVRSFGTHFLQQLVVSFVNFRLEFHGKIVWRLCYFTFASLAVNLWLLLTHEHESRHNSFETSMVCQNVFVFVFVMWPSLKHLNRLTILKRFRKSSFKQCLFFHKFQLHFYAKFNTHSLFVCLFQI